MSQILPKVFLVNKVLLETTPIHVCAVYGCFSRLKRIVEIEATRPPKLKIFTIWLITERSALHSYHTLESNP